MLDDNGNVVGTSKVAARHVCCSVLTFFFIYCELFRCSFIDLCNVCECNVVPTLNDEVSSYQIILIVDFSY